MSSCNLLISKRTVQDPETLVGKSSHHVHNNEKFLQHLKGSQLGPDKVIISYDVKALFTSVPIQPALTIIEKLLEEDSGLVQKHL